MKKLLQRFISICLLGLSPALSFANTTPSTLSPRVFLPAGMTFTKQFNSQNTYGFFDIHDVLGDIYKGGMAWIGITNPGTTIKYFTNPISDIKKDLKKNSPNAPGDEFIFRAAQKDPSMEKYIPVFLDIANCRTPMQGMPEILKKLKTSGYELYIISNIGQHAYHGWQSAKKDSKGKPKYSAIGLKDKLFKEIFWAFNQDVEVAAHKPEPQGFVNMKNRVNPKNTKYMFFVDDKRENINAAVAQGYIGILFIDAKKFESDLKSLGILS